jgi:hypothetical protein
MAQTPSLSAETLSGYVPVSSPTVKSVVRSRSGRRSSPADHDPEELKEETVLTNGAGHPNGESIATFRGAVSAMRPSKSASVQSACSWRIRAEPSVQLSEQTAVAFG